MTVVVVMMMKVRQNLTLRSLEALMGIDAVTMARCVNRVTKIIGAMAFKNKARGFSIVDTTSVRVATTQVKAYSG